MSNRWNLTPLVDLPTGAVVVGGGVVIVNAALMTAWDRWLSETVIGRPDG